MSEKSEDQEKQEETQEEPNIVQYEPSWKNLTISIGEKLHADFRIRLKYEGIGQAKKVWDSAT